MGTPGSASGLGKRAGSNSGTAPQADSTGSQNYLASRCRPCPSTWSLTQRTCSAGWPLRSVCGVWPATRSSPPGRFLADINALHPFREGNGRAQRAFFSQLAHDAGHFIAWVAWTLTATWPPALPPTTATWPGSGKCPEIPAAG